MSDFKDKIAIVTGASRGIGRAIALELGSRGATVVVNFRSSHQEADEVVEQIKSNGGDALAFQADVVEEEQVKALFKAVTDTYQKVDILVNNAGMTRDNVIMMMQTEDFDAVINTNLRSAWLCSKYAVRTMMRKRYGRIINITSVSGILGNGGQTNYSASKAGLIGLTKALAREVATRNITVNAVAPGFVETEMTANLGEEVLKNIQNAIPLGRFGHVQDVSKAVAYLASDDAAYVTGHVLVVDGGMAM